MPNRDLKLDKEETAILASFDRSEWKRSKVSKTLVKQAQKASGEFLKKDARINIRISSTDLDRIKQIAVREGLSYQTLITSILHKFASAY
jgi:predicted DNA binding CopG/RHH family protein